MTTVTDGRRARGDASRRAVLARATQLASVEGLDGLSIGALATETGRSKSTIATLFGDKQGLQLATIDAAAEVFREHVVETARRVPHGAGRIAALLAAMLAYSRDRVFEGGCFFAAVSADLDSKPGPAADAVRSWTRQWHDYVERQLRTAMECGDLRADTDVDQLAFELIALAEGANVRSLLANDARPYARAASAIRAALLRAGAPPETLGALEL
jgi:AcrR family transcriptional regulator